MFNILRLNFYFLLIPPLLNENAGSASRDIFCNNRDFQAAAIRVLWRNSSPLIVFNHSTSIVRIDADNDRIIVQIYNKTDKFECVLTGPFVELGNHSLYFLFEISDVTIIYSYNGSIVYNQIKCTGKYLQTVFTNLTVAGANDIVIEYKMSKNEYKFYPLCINQSKFNELQKGNNDTGYLLASGIRIRGINIPDNSFEKGNIWIWIILSCLFTFIITSFVCYKYHNGIVRWIESKPRFVRWIRSKLSRNKATHVDIEDNNKPEETPPVNDYSNQASVIITGNGATCVNLGDEAETPLNPQPNVSITQPEASIRSHYDLEDVGISATLSINN